MPNTLELTVACGDYEIVRPLMDGTVRPDGITPIFATEMDSTTRHWRFLRNRDFDVAEVSASGYVAAKALGHDFEAIPVFPHRRFRHGFIYVNTAKGIEKPADLAGRKVGVKSYIVTATLWLRGILKEDYGVAHESIEWFSELDEDVEIRLPEGVSLTRIADDKSIETMLVDGEIDALLHPDLIAPIRRQDPRVGRLFPDFKAEEIAYYERTGIFPIMHVLAIKREIVERYPFVAINLYKAFDEARRIAMRRMQDPRRVPLAWYREAWEEQQRLLGDDPWEYGPTAANRHNVETLARYAFDQGLTDRPMGWEDLFLDLGQGRRRGHVARF